MKRLWWVRHAPTHAKKMIGWSDISADTSDTSAFTRLNAYLPKSAPIISSTLMRATQTAAMLADNRQIFTPNPDLREIHFGAWEGLTFDEANAQDPKLLGKFWENAGPHSAPNGESWNDLRGRVDKAADALALRTEQDIIVVAHFGAILTQVQRTLNIKTQEAFSHKIDNLSVTCLSYDGQWGAETINHIL